MIMNSDYVRIWKETGVCFMISPDILMEKLNNTRNLRTAANLNDI
jgi:hypothetical protein